jgi:hypothetical protein
VLALWGKAPESAAGQSVDPEQQPRGRKSGTLGQNYPNPFNADTHIPFSITCTEGGAGDHVASVRIYNVLAQLVAIPIAQDSGEPLDGIKLTCGDHVAYWDGKVRRSGHEASPGIYIYGLVVDGERSAKKMLIAR